ncbi:MAG: hypothetical protein VB138_05850 [Burkholderia sp.]
MSLETALAENTAAMKELVAALLAAGTLQSAPGVAAVAKAQQAADAANRAANPKGGEHESVDAARAAAQEQSRTASAAAAAKKSAAAASAASASGVASASTTASSSPDPTSLHDWHEKTAAMYASLKDGEPTLDNLRKAVLGINGLVGRTQAAAVLQRFGAAAITEKKEGDTVIKKGLLAEQYPAAFALCIDVLAGRVDATASLASE